MPLPEEVSYLALRGCKVTGAFGFYHDDSHHSGDCSAKELFLRCCHRHINSIILVLSGGALPLSFKDADDREGYFFYPDDFSHRVCISKKVVHNGLP